MSRSPDLRRSRSRDNDTALSHQRRSPSLDRRRSSRSPIRRKSPSPKRSRSRDRKRSPSPQRRSRSPDRKRSRSHSHRSPDTSSQQRRSPSRESYTKAKRSPSPATPSALDTIVSPKKSATPPPKKALDGLNDTTDKGVDLREFLKRKKATNTKDPKVEVTVEGKSVKSPEKKARTPITAPVKTPEPAAAGDEDFIEVPCVSRHPGCQVRLFQKVTGLSTCTQCSESFCYAGALHRKPHQQSSSN